MQPYFAWQLSDHALLTTELESEESKTLPFQQGEECNGFSLSPSTSAKKHTQKLISVCRLVISCMVMNLFKELSLLLKFINEAVSDYTSTYKSDAYLGNITSLEKINITYIKI